MIFFSNANCSGRRGTPGDRRHSKNRGSGECGDRSVALECRSMTADDRIALIRVKIEWAKQHFAELKVGTLSWLESDPYEFATKRDPQTRELIYFLNRVSDPQSQSNPSLRRLSRLGLGHNLLREKSRGEVSHHCRPARLPPPLCPLSLARVCSCRNPCRLLLCGRGRLWCPPLRRSLEFGLRV